MGQTNGPIGVNWAERMVMEREWAAFPFLFYFEFRSLFYFVFSSWIQIQMCFTSLNECTPTHCIRQKLIL